ncbi:phospho-N-acetylmuramoyl-pentapeptide-transferase [Candidatus Peregrinibacteria bacterium CG_4_9_14_0_2_um_filter_53_11]|nr:MAG: phospho-N-acetylmuramoyl-pentapeptide-transferase [Candidatus Peregrinibacteria bacterium CG_4_9_14_0_2_um_filter_53_11]
MFPLGFELQDVLRHFYLIFGVTLLAFILVMLLTKPFYRILIKHGVRKQLRDTAADGGSASIFNQLHASKSGTPTMGGVLIWLTVAIIVLISPLAQWLGLARFSLLNRNETYLPIFTLISTGLLGLLDDYLNIRGGKNKGLKVKPKFFWLTLFALAGGLWFYYKLGYDLIHIPGYGDLALGPWYIALFTFIVVAGANAVNITDGLDGLAGGLTLITFTALGIIAYFQGLVILAAFCGMIVGTTMAFLWFNIPPALFYMGDTGALALGATMGVIAMLTNSAVVLPLVAFIFVVEAASSSIQLLSKRWFKRKVFLIAPLHHHFEARGWGEAKVVMRFWIVGALIAFLGVLLHLLSLLPRIPA